VGFVLCCARFCDGCAGRRRRECVRFFVRFLCVFLQTQRSDFIRSFAMCEKLFDVSHLESLAFFKNATPKRELREAVVAGRVEPEFAFINAAAVRGAF
jgi:hypothetical protein